MVVEVCSTAVQILAVLVVLQLPASIVGAQQIGSGAAQAEPDTASYGVVDSQRAAIAFSGNEELRYAIAYTGGVRLGSLILQVRPVADRADSFVLDALVTTKGSFLDTVYPVHDVHQTQVSGTEKYPYHYEVWQREGFSYEAHRVTTYDQITGKISYRKNDNEPVEYGVETPIHNEFSAFFSSRLMDFVPGKSFSVPTFADKRRVEVEVKVIREKTLSVAQLGQVATVEVSPILKFKGLYDKRGDTTIWYTDDECRVPVRITSKLAIGSVTSTLLSYRNPACGRYSGLPVE